MFRLDSRFEETSDLLIETPLSQVRLVNDSRFPWLLLIPQKNNVTELTDLSEEESLQFLKETRLLSDSLQEKTQADKMNIATLGNVVPQLHLHIIGRFIDDSAWPNPVWAQGISIPYTPEEHKQLKNKLKNAFEALTF